MHAQEKNAGMHAATGVSDSSYSTRRYLISQHPEVEAKVLAELEELQLLASPQRTKPRQLDFSDLTKLTYLSCCIKVCTHFTTAAPVTYAESPLLQPCITQAERRHLNLCRKKCSPICQFAGMICCPRREGLTGSAFRVLKTGAADQ